MGSSKRCLLDGFHTVSKLLWCLEESCYESESEIEVSDDCDNYYSNESDTKTKIVT